MADQSEIPQTFPFLCPADSMLKNDTSISTLCDTAPNIAKRTRFCIVCDYPMNVKIVLFPCTHYVCYSCYCANPIQCRRCDISIKTIKRLGDYETFYACDNEKCNKYFDSEAKLKDHLPLHSAN